MTYAVIIPVFNAAHTLERALLSVLRQTWAPEEVWIIDDASTDLLDAVLVKFKSEPKVHLIRLDSNQGVSAARNVGWNRASTDWVAFLDADDEWHPRKMEFCRPYLSKTRVLCHGFQFEDWSRVPLNDHNDWRQTRITFGQLLLRNTVASCALVVRRDIDIRYDERMRYTEDHDLLLRLSGRHSILKIDAPLARVHRALNSKGGLSGNLWAMRKGEINMYLKLIKENTAWILAVPFLIIYSLMKHCRLLLKRMV